MELEIISISLAVWANLLITLLLLFRSERCGAIAFSWYECFLCFCVVVLMSMSAVVALIQVLGY